MTSLLEDVRKGREVQDAVRYAIARIARCDDRPLEQGQLRRRDVRRGAEQGLRVPGEREEQPRPRGRRRPRHDAVVVVRIPLRFHQRLSAAIGARCEAGPPGGGTVEGGDYRLGLHLAWSAQDDESWYQQVEREFGMNARPQTAATAHPAGDD